MRVCVCVCVWWWWGGVRVWMHMHTDTCTHTTYVNLPAGQFHTCASGPVCMCGAGGVCFTCINGPVSLVRDAREGGLKALGPLSHIKGGVDDLQHTCARKSAPPSSPPPPPPPLP